jgi:Flp pilus assembly protein TadD
MQEAAEDTVLGDFEDASFTYAGTTSRFFRRGGDFIVRTDGPDGRLADFKIAYTFGVRPLQQYLVEFPGGRLQALSISWDTRPKEEGGERWFHLYPDERVDHRDPLHWTKRFQNWNYMCANCHSTNLRKNYRAETNAYETAWSELDVSCEACHGPGSQHVKQASTASEAERAGGLLVDLGDSDGGIWEMDMATGLSKRVPPRISRAELGTCAPCHSRRSTIAEAPLPGDSFLDGHRPAFLDEVLYHEDGQILDEVYEYGSFVQSKMYREGVTCKDCHDPHRLSLRTEGNSVCAACHLPEKFGSPKHHFHEPGSEGAQCASCHMPSRRYMVIDERRDHSFRIPRPDLSEKLGTPNACTACHQNRSNAWAAEAVSAWYGENRELHYGEAIHAGRLGLAGGTSALSALAADTKTPAIARGTALMLLERYPTPSSADRIQISLQDPDPLVRIGAAYGARSLEPSLRHRGVFPLLNDPLRAVRLEAVRALASVPEEWMSPEQRSRFAEVLEEYRSGQMVNADWPEAHMNLGVLYAERGDIEKAESSYRKALRLDPDFSGGYVNLADLYRVQGRDAEGEKLLREGLERLPQSADLHHSLGLLFVRQKRSDEALPAFARAAELRPDETRYAYVYAVALESRGELRRAIDVLEKAHEGNPQDREVLFALASFHQKAGQASSALDFAEKLLALAPDDPQVRELASALRKQE